MIVEWVLILVTKYHFTEFSTRFESRESCAEVGEVWRKPRRKRRAFSCLEVEIEEPRRIPHYSHDGDAWQ
jgi:hypothetical protein